MDSIPKTYRQMLVYFMSGSGGWAMLLLLCSAILMKFHSGWFWWDLPLLAILFSLRGIFEWLNHSLIYHANPLPFTRIRIKSSLWRQHLEHHKDPYDLSRILITYKGAIAPPLLTFLFSYTISRDFDISSSLFFSVLVLGCFNEIGHLVCHCRIYHKSDYMKRFVAFHRYHHFKDPNKFYGVTSSFGDRIFGTGYTNQSLQDELND